MDQELSVAIMARAAKEMGYKLYVKEHFVQPYRNRTFYEDLYQIENVRLIGTDYDSKELVKGSFAALPETGLWCWNRSYGHADDDIRRKWVSGLSRVYRVGSVEECKQAIRAIGQGEGKRHFSERDSCLSGCLWGKFPVFLMCIIMKGAEKDSPRFQESKEKLIACIKAQLVEKDE